jgi:hypothetical protein
MGLSSAICTVLLTSQLYADHHDTLHTTTALRNTERVKSVFQVFTVTAALLATNSLSHQVYPVAYAGIAVGCCAVSVAADKLIKLFHTYEFNHQDNE